MAKKIVFIQGSPRKNGNTRAMTNIAMAAAKRHGAEVTEIDATTLEFKVPGCMGCRKCQETEEFKCVVDDGVARAVATLGMYDAVILATPLFWWSYSAQLKIFIDRMFSTSKVNDPQNYRSLLAGKTFGLLATAGGPVEENLEVLELQWKNPALMMGSPFTSCLFPNTSPEPGVLSKDPAAVQKAEDFGRSLAL
ncbi:MAG: flavodoxin family protein [Desulfobacteraceae bacterium]|jgi:multimeric flavodoxin WrbA